MIDGQTARLRPWRDADVPFLGEMRNDVALQAELLSRPRGNSDAQVREWLTDRTHDAGGLFLIVADVRNDQPLGYLQLTGIDSIDLNADLGICLYGTAQGHGVGSESLRLLHSHMRRVWGLRKVSLRVREDNTRAIACYERVGYQRCGRLREHTFIDGAWRDLVLMEIFLSHATSP